MVEVFGDIVDNETRCVHYHSEVDVIAIKFYCCKRYYPCYKCHEHHSDHEIQKWPSNKLDELMILCGKCGKELTFNQYNNPQSQCAECSAQFNCNCKLHYNIYFNLNDQSV